jgi:voltage-gated potassium channel
MPRSRRRLRRPDPSPAKRKSWRLRFLALLANWNRYQVGRIILGLIVTWLIGSVILFCAERGETSGYSDLTESLWSVWALLFSGLNEDYTPHTAVGRTTAMFLLVAGVGLAGLFTASVASLLVERYLRRSDVSNFEMDDHLVLCNWSPRGLEWIREVHSKIITEPRPIVIIHDNPDEIDLPDKQDDPAFNDVYIVKGDPTNEVILHRATVPKAYSVVVLSDAREGRHADGKSILICVAIRHICRGEHCPNIVVECHNPGNRHHLLKAGASEVVSSESLGLRLLARSALFHGMSEFYQELLTVRRHANEVFLVPTPEDLIGRDFTEVSEGFLRHRSDRRSCLLIGIQRGDEMMLNPIGEEAGPLQVHDQLILLSRSYPTGSQPLPISLAAAPAQEAKSKK